MAPPAALLTIQQPAVYYRDQLVLENVKLQIHAGERIALLGKSGAGKSTLLTLIYRQLIQQAPQQRIGWIPQQLGLVDNLSVFHNVYMGQLNQHRTLYNLLNLIWPQKKPLQAVRQWLQQFEMEACCFKSAGELSGGQQQRVAIARALHSGPDIVLADEPVSNLDQPMARRVIASLLEHSRSTVIALHDTELAMSFADRIIGIQQGNIVLNAAPADIDHAQLEPLYDHDQAG
jgi:phosphonate transport system ATP-binding protein